MGWALLILCSVFFTNSVIGFWTAEEFETFGLQNDLSVLIRLIELIFVEGVEKFSQNLHKSIDQLWKLKPRPDQ